MFYYMFGYDLDEIRDTYSNLSLAQNVEKHAYEISFTLNCYSLGDLMSFCGFDASGFNNLIKQYSMSPAVVRSNYDITYVIVLTADNKIDYIDTELHLAPETQETANYKKIFSAFSYTEKAIIKDSLKIKMPSNLSDY